MKTRIHVNQHNIKHNKKHGTNLPVITAKDYLQNRKGNSVTIWDEHENVVAKVVYKPDNPLPCGAHCWVETHYEVTVDE